MAHKKLSELQQAFVDAYDGLVKTTVAAMRKEGLVISYGYARSLMTRDDIKRAIRARDRASGAAKRRSNKKSKAKAKRIANRKERQQFWTAMMDNKKAGAGNRLRASELLGRSEADFTDKVQHGVDGSLAGLLEEIGQMPRVLPRDERSDGGN